MATIPVRVPEDRYEELREVAAKLDIPLSQAADIVLETGIERMDLRQHLSLDPDLEKELGSALLQADTEEELHDISDELYLRQMDRNRERSELVEAST